jgi:type II secretory pathway component GspD/PulD (secretin)
MIGRFLKLVFLGLLSVAPACFAQMPLADSSFDIVAQPISVILTLYYKEVSRGPYVLCGDVLADTRLVSIRAKGKALDGPLMVALLGSFGYVARSEKGVVVVCKKRDVVVDDSDDESLIYRVKNRDSAYLVDFLTPLVRGRFANNRASGGALAVGGAPSSGADGKSVPQAVSPGGSLGSSSGSYHASSGDDFIVFTGKAKELSKVEKLLVQLDVPTGEVMIKVYMYEVGKNANDASALQLFMSAIKGRLSGELGDVIPASPIGNFIRLKTASIDLVASALKSDGRFKVVTSPSARSRSGKSARFVSGAQVPVLGSIVTNQSGSTQQSYDRIESGTILEVSPVVHDRNIDVDIFQQVSSFVSTQIGLNAPPTLNKRELRTSLSVEDGELVVIAGLNESKEDESKSGLSFLPFSLAKSSSNNSSELLLVLELKRL